MFNLIFFIVSVLTIAGGNFLGESYPVMTFEPSGDSFDVRGTIDSRTIEDLKTALADNPHIKTLRLINVPGSVDDENSLTQLSDFIQAQGLKTLVPSNGVVSSGGTDLALMGNVRVIEPGACIGIHSWATEEPIEGQTNGSKLPKSHSAHQLYLNFYHKVGVPEAFYWRTQEAAGPDEMYWMSPQEIIVFNLSHIRLSDDTQETIEQREQRCEARLKAGL